MQGSSLLILKDRHQSGIVITTISSSQLVRPLLLFFQVCQHHHNQHQCLRCLLCKWIKKWTKDMQDSLRVNTSFSSRFIKKSNEFGSLNKKERCFRKDIKLSMKLQKLARMHGVSDKSFRIHTTILSHKSSQQTNQPKNLLIPSLPRSQPMLNLRVSLLKHQVKAQRRRNQYSPIITLTSNTTE